MSTDTRNSKSKSKGVRHQITWDALIVDAEGQIKASQATIRKLKRSIRFFREQKGDGKLFPKIEG